MGGYVDGRVCGHVNGWAVVGWTVGRQVGRSADKWVDCMWMASRCVPRQVSPASGAVADCPQSQESDFD